jgi:photosystem II PsbY protein
LPITATQRSGSGNGAVVLKITPSFLAFTMDLRLVLVAAPIVLAASWAVFHIGRAAVGQLQMFINRGRAA